MSYCIASLVIFVGLSVPLGYYSGEVIGYIIYYAKYLRNLFNG